MIKQIKVHVVKFFIFEFLNNICILKFVILGNNMQYLKTHLTCIKVMIYLLWIYTFKDIKKKCWLIDDYLLF